MPDRHDKPIRVTVVRFGDRPHLQMQYVDPISGRKKTRTTNTANKREAERLAGQWEKELRAGTYREPSKVTWGEFRKRYEREQLPSLAEGTESKVVGILDSLERELNLTSESKLRDVTADRLSVYSAVLRTNGRSESTIAGHLAHLGAALRWATKVKLLTEAPDITRPRRAKGGKQMKGRPVIGEEFERMLERTARVVGDEAAESWRHYLRGLWWSGLRLEESLQLYWDRQDRLCVDLTGRRPMLRIPGDCHKSGVDTLLPIAPEFAQLLLSTPESERTGRVFQPVGKDGAPMCSGRVSRTVTAIGKAAGVKVNVDPRSGKVKFASAHDLRRSFGERWAARVMPTVLKELMRHESVETTLRYYVGRNAAATAEILWQAVGCQEANSLTDTTPSPMMRA